MEFTIETDYFKLLEDKINDLINRIQNEYPEIAHYNYRVAVNHEIINEEPELKNLDEVAFMPPFAGG